MYVLSKGYDKSSRKRLISAQPRFTIPQLHSSAQPSTMPRETQLNAAPEQTYEPQQLRRRLRNFTHWLGSKGNNNSSESNKSQSNSCSAFGLRLAARQRTPASVKQRQCVGYSCLCFACAFVRAFPTVIFEVLIWSV